VEAIIEALRDERLIDRDGMLILQAYRPGELTCPPHPSMVAIMGAADARQRLRARSRARDIAVAGGARRPASPTAEACRPKVAAAATPEFRDHRISLTIRWRYPPATGDRSPIPASLSDPGGPPPIG